MKSFHEKNLAFGTYMSSFDGHSSFCVGVYVKRKIYLQNQWTFFSVICKIKGPEYTVASKFKTPEEIKFSVVAVSSRPAAAQL